MDFPERFSNLPEYAFGRLRALLDVHAPGGNDVLNMTIGEPRHAMPDFVADVLQGALSEFGKYPVSDGAADLLSAISAWIERRYGVALDPARQIMALNGSREGLFNATLALCPERKNGAQPSILIPNPFYQVYAAGALAVAADPVYLPATAATGHLPDVAALPAELLDRTAIVWVCSPANPQGAVAGAAYWDALLRLAEKHDFRVFADECYSEIWREAPPPGALESVARTGIDPERVLVFNSLSKRSNLPGLRSGFVAGGPQAIRRIKDLRAYAGAPLPGPLQHVSRAAWADEAHVEASRQRYLSKYAIADRVLAGIPGYCTPEAGFFLWLPVPDGEAAALKLWREAGIRVLPGAYLGREVNGENPGTGFVRVAMVVDEPELERGLTRLRACLYE
jgi:aspartate/methionine/tyrosine aminotransferase